MCAPFIGTTHLDVILNLLNCNVPCQIQRNKIWIFHPANNFKIFKFSTISSACQLALRPDSTSTMPLVFSHKKGNHHQFTKLLYWRMFIHCTTIFPLILCLFPFSSSHLWKGVDRLSWLLIMSHKKVACKHEHIYETPLIYNRHDVFVCTFLHHYSQNSLTSTCKQHK